MTDARVFCGVVLFSSFFEMWAGGIVWDYMDTAVNGETQFATFLGLASLVVCIIQMCLFFFMDGFAQKASPFVAGTLFILWICGIAVSTFKTPFKDSCGGASSTAVIGSGTANGYFSTWLGVVASGVWFASAVPQVGEYAEKAKPTGEDGMYVAGLILSSLVVMVQGSYDCDNTSYADGCSNGEGWAVSAGVMSAAIGLLVQFVPQIADFKRFIWIFVALIWFVSVAVLTYSYKDATAGDTGIFIHTGNGFFATWVSAFMSFYLVYESWAGEKVQHADPRFYAGLIVIASFFEFWAAGALCGKLGDDNCTDEYAFAVAWGLISCVLSIVMMVLYTTCPEAAKTVQPFSAGFFFIYWFVGVAVMNFKKPFHTPCSMPNGYFASWICLIAASLWITHVPQVQTMASSVTKMASGADGHYILPLILSSFVVWVDAAYSCSNNSDGCTTANSWAISVGTISFIFFLIVYFAGAKIGDFKKYAYVFFVAWWFVAVVTLTFNYKGDSCKACGDYSNLGNGFVGTWASFFLALVLAYCGFTGSDPFAGAIEESAGDTPAGEAGTEAGTVAVEEGSEGSTKPTDETTKPTDEAEEQNPVAAADDSANAGLALPEEPHDDDAKPEDEAP